MERQCIALERDMNRIMAFVKIQQTQVYEHDEETQPSVNVDIRWHSEDTTTLTSQELPMQGPEELEVPKLYRHMYAPEHLMYVGDGIVLVGTLMNPGTMELEFTADLLVGNERVEWTRTKSTMPFLAFVARPGTTIVPEAYEYQFHCPVHTARAIVSHCTEFPSEDHRDNVVYM